MKIDNAISSRKNYYLELDKYLHTELEKMVAESCPISVSALARRCSVTRTTIYRHTALFEQLKHYREMQ